MLRRLALAVIGLVAASHSVVAQQAPPVAPRLVLRTIMTSADVTDEQKAQIKATLDQQKPDIKAALETGDAAALRQVLRPLMREILSTLTPAQRQAVRDAVARQLQDQPQSR